ncbi:MAG: factor-independent urate hydroxylase [Streptosporangiaceae bacterium]
MTIVLGANQFGKAETRVVRVDRDGDRHALRDLNVSVALAGDLDGVHLSGDNSAVLTTDTQKNTVFAFARRHGIASPEDFALLLAGHFVGSQPTVHRARVSIEEFGWERIPATGHSFVRTGQEIRTARITHTAGATHVLSGLRELTVLNSTGSEFWGYLKDEYTTLPETRERVLATSVTAQWRHDSPDGDWDSSYQAVKSVLLDAFAVTHSLSLQQTLFTMGRRVLQEVPGIAEIRFAMPNKHHFLVDLAPFGLDNPDEVYYAADRPYGLIEGTILRDDVPAAEDAWTS